MRQRAFGVVVLVILVALVFPATSAARVSSDHRRPGADLPAGHVKGLPTFVQKWMSEKARAADLVAQGRARVDRQGRVRLSNGDFVDYELAGTDHIVTVLVEFADGVEGPLHNQIAEPDRDVDNTTYWVPDFNRQHFLDLMFAPEGGSAGIISTRDLYLEMSSGRYTVEGQVSEWVQVPFPESQYGANGPDGPASDNANGPVSRLIGDAFDAMNPATPAVDWSPSIVDVWDRYDCDGDANFDEPDGYVDHFQLVHAGQGEEDGGGAQGGDAIWSHRSYANVDGFGVVGPPGCLLGGYPVGVNNLYVADYTMEPENGGVGVFAHEFGHDLGLPDLYDTQGANDNSVSFWSLMADGANVSDDPNSIGTKPVHMGAWEKLALGWLEGDLVTVEAGDNDRVRLGPAEGATANAAQAIRIDLPDYRRTIRLFQPEGNDPFYYYSGQGDDLDNDMNRALDAPLAADTELTFRANYDIETDWDYAYVRYSTDGGTTWVEADGNLSTDTNPNGQNFGHGITGSSGGWVTGTYTIPAGATHIRFRYWTDVAVVEPGFAVDSIRIGSEPVDDGSTPDAWTLNGFRQIRDGSYRQRIFHYYLVESRNYVRADTSLCGAYLFLTETLVERKCYADGVLIWYRNSGFGNNNVSQHPGAGQILVVDSHPAPAPEVVGPGDIRGRWQTWDSTFGFERHAIRLHEYDRNDVLRERRYVARPISEFYDSAKRAYWDPDNPLGSVRTAGSGVRVTLLKVLADGVTYKVWVH